MLGSKKCVLEYMILSKYIDLIDDMTPEFTPLDAPLFIYFGQLLATSM